MKRARKPRGKPPREVPASEMKNAWHEYLDRVTRGREEIILTRYGKPIARLVPVSETEPSGVFGWLRGTVTATDDLVAGTGQEWEADA
jgi:prevent-host-death family protein